MKHHVCLQKAAEALVRYRSDGLVTAIKQECLKMSFKTMFRIAQDDFCRQTVPHDWCGAVQASRLGYRAANRPPDKQMKYTDNTATVLKHVHHCVVIMHFYFTYCLFRLIHLR